MSPVLLMFLVVVAAAGVAAFIRLEPLRARLFNLLKAAATILLFYILLTHQVKMEDGSLRSAGSLVLDTLRQVDAKTFWIWCGAAAGIKFVGILASMYRWLTLLRGQGIELPFRHIFGSFLIGRFIGTFLPSTAGLDGYKLFDAARFSGRTVEVTATTALEKVIGVFGIFLSFLVAMPFGMKIFGDQATLIASITVPVALGFIVALLAVLWYPGFIQWALDKLPLPGKQRLTGLVMRISNSAAAYRDRKALVLLALGLSFIVHFTTAVMYYFTALAIGAKGAEFWPIAFGSSIQIFATVVSPFTIAGEGIREAAQYALLGAWIGPGPAIVSAALGFWAAEALTLAGGVFWWIRPAGYTPAWCRVDGQQVDYERAALAALELETDEERARREATPAEALEPLGARLAHNAGLGLGAGVLSGLLIGVIEACVIASGGFGEEAQVAWYGPLVYAVVLGGMGLAGGAVLGLLPMGREEARGWTPSLGVIGTLLPLGLAITVFRLRRDVYLEQMPPAPVLIGVLAAFGALALLLFFAGPRLFRGSFGKLVRPLGAAGALVAVVIAGFAASLVFGPAAPTYGSGDGVPAHLAERPNVILVMVDTLRADHLDCYGATDVETPNLCSLARDGGTVFDGYSHASWTKPATASLVTSLLPSSHKAMSKPSRLSEDIEFLSEALQAHGYETGGIVSNINLAQSFGFDQGFDEYHYLGPSYLAGAEESSSKIILYQIARSVWFKIKGGSLVFSDFYQDSEVVNDAALDWLDRHKDDRFYLFLHYMDPHDPYFAHPYGDQAVARVTGDPDPERAAELRELYVGEIEYLDHNFGKLLDELKRLGVYGDTLIVLTSDHGEEFHEHGGWWHGLTLYDEQIRVPLLAKWPAGKAPLPADQTQQVARLIDVAPTLLARAGAEVPAAMQGIDLVTPVASRSEKDLQVFSEEDHEGNVLWSLRTNTMKLIAANPGNHRGLPEKELFDIANDPGERRNLFGGDLGEVELRLAQHADLQRRAAEGSAVEGGGDVEMDRAECEQLRMLGYIEDCSHIPN